jgi:hypothetical protein
MADPITKGDIAASDEATGASKSSANAFATRLLAPFASAMGVSGTAGRTHLVPVDDPRAVSKVDEPQQDDAL